MKATAVKLLEFLKKSPQFIIPIYQRTYSWTEPQCEQLWNDIIRTGENDDIAAHFIGSIVYIEKGLYQVSSLSPLLVIDGQQRLTTVTLIIEALARHLGDTEPIEGFSAKKLRNYYLLNPLEEGEKGYKLLLTQTDKQSLISVVLQKKMPAEHSLRVKNNFEFFEDKIKALGDDLTSLCRGLSKLIVVDISLNRDQDNPQLIFESMNSTGKELSQADLIRNYILMGLEPDHQTRLYEDHWRPMEVAFGQEAYESYFDSFMRHFLTIKTGEIPRQDQVYEVFKSYSGQKEIAEAGVDQLVADIHNYANYFCAITLGKESNPKLAEAFRDIRELKVDVAYPFLLKLYGDYVAGLITVDDMEYLVRLVESYVFRRAVCSIPTNSMNKTFATFGKSIKKDNYVESVKAHLMLLPSYRRFPANDEFEREMRTRDLYNFKRSNYWLRRLENYGRKERVYVEEYTIEHILPQNENLSKKWQESLGSNWKEVQETWLHTLGNLTLTGYNSEYSDRPFDEKRDMEGGFKQSPLHMNDGLGSLESWNEDQIKKRAKKLAAKANEVWLTPVLDEEVLKKYRQRLTGTESLDDYKYIKQHPELKDLFHGFKKEVTALDECISEELKKKCITFTAETNLVDVVPRAGYLRLFLNMKYSDLHDPKEVAKDVSTRKKKAGYGNVLVDVGSSEEISYAIGLVRQALEQQMELAES